MGHLVDAIEHVYRVLGSEDAAGGDEMFFQLVLARIVGPVSKLDSAPVLEEAGVAAASYRTVKRRLPVYANQSWRQRLSAACADAVLSALPNTIATQNPATITLAAPSALLSGTDRSFAVLDSIASVKVRKEQAQRGAC